MSRNNPNRVAAVVPMRHSSERIPGKNYRELAGVPLFHYVIRALLESDGVDHVVIDTDSDAIEASAREYFPSVEVVRRPDSLRAGSTSMNAVLAHTVRHVKADTVLQTHSTNPFMRPSTFARAINQFDERSHLGQTLIGITRIQARAWDKNWRPLNHSGAILARTQDLPPILIENSCVFVFDREEFLRTGSRVSKQPIPFEVSALEAIDIDYPDEWDLAEIVARGLKG